MLTLTFLGVGSAFAKRNFQSNALIEAWSAGPDKQPRPDETLLIDFGTTGPLALHRLMSEPSFEYLNDRGAIRYAAIPNILVTHLHADHIGGLEELATVNRYAAGGGRPFRPRLIASSEVLRVLWNHSLRGGLGTLPGRTATLEDFFDPHPIQPLGRGNPDYVRMLGRYDIALLPTDHIRVRVPYDWASFGVVAREMSTGDTAVYSGDTRFDPGGLGEHLERAKIVFHEAQLTDQADPVHTLLSELRTLPEAVRRKTLLYHFDDRWDDPCFGRVAEEFAGFAEPRRRYVLFE